MPSSDPVLDLQSDIQACAFLTVLYDLLEQPTTILYFCLAQCPLIAGDTVFDICERVEKLVAGRRAGLISLRQFELQIKNFTSSELACLAATVLESDPVRRNNLERALRRGAKIPEGFSRRVKTQH